MYTVSFIIRIWVCIAFYFIILEGKFFSHQGQWLFVTVNSVNDGIFHHLSWQPYHLWAWPVVWISVIIGHSNFSLYNFAICWVTRWQWCIRRPPCPEEDNRDNVYEHRDDDDEHHGAAETIAVESDGSNCYLALGGRNDCRRERRGQMLPCTAR